MDESIALPRLRLEAPDDALTPLVRAAQADPRAFGPLYERYLDRVYAYLRARTGSAEEAHDLAQQVFVQALAALPQFRGQGAGFAPWLFRIARNLVRNHQTRQRASAALHLLPEAAQPVAPGDPEAATLRREATARVRQLVAGLSPDKRELLALRFAAGLTAAQIAAVIGKSEAATKKQLARTIQSLQEHYHDRT